MLEKFILNKFNKIIRILVVTVFIKQFSKPVFEAWWKIAFNLSVLLLVSGGEKFEK